MALSQTKFIFINEYEAYVYGEWLAEIMYSMYTSLYNVVKS